MLTLTATATLPTLAAPLAPEPTPGAPPPPTAPEEPPRRRHGIELRNDSPAWAGTFALLVKMLALDALTTGAPVHVTLVHTGADDALHGVWADHRADVVHVIDYDGRRRRVPVHTVTCLTVHP